MRPLAQSLQAVVLSDDLGDEARLLATLALARVAQAMPLDNHSAGGRSYRSDAERALLPACARVVQHASGLDPSSPEREILLDAATEALAQTASRCSLPAARRSALGLARDWGRRDRTREDRQRSCVLIGALAACAEADGAFCRDTLLALLLPMCQDTSGHVRERAAHQLPLLALRMEPKDVRSKLAPEVVELLADEEPAVIVAAMRASLVLAPMLPPGDRRTRLLPALCLLLDAARVPTRVVAQPASPAATSLFASPAGAREAKRDRLRQRSQGTGGGTGSGSGGGAG